MFNLNNYDYEIKIIKMCSSHRNGADTVVYYNFRAHVNYNGMMHKKTTCTVLY